MLQEFSKLHGILNRTREAIGQFVDMVQPFVDQAEDQHSRLYYHHILEEEEQRLGRLNELIPRLESMMSEINEESLSNRELTRFLSDINLERFGLHNFREHLELAMYEFQDEQHRNTLQSLREMTQNDYLAMKDVMSSLTNRISEADVTRFVIDHDEGHAVHEVDHVAASASTTLLSSAPAPESAPAPAPVRMKKGLTVGSLKQT
jgi:hypothetical protein